MLRHRWTHIKLTASAAGNGTEVGGMGGPFLPIVEAKPVLPERIVKPTLFGRLKNGDLATDAGRWKVASEE